MIKNIDDVLTRLDFSRSELVSLKHRGLWYAAIAAMALAVIGLVALNILTLIA